MNTITEQTLTEFSQWLADRRVIGASIAGEALYLADGTPTATWIIDLRNRAVTAAAFKVLADSGRKVWCGRVTSTRYTGTHRTVRAEHAGPYAMRLTGQRAEAHSWLWDASTLLHTLRPFSTTDNRWERDPRIDPLGFTATSPADAAVLTARLVTELHTGSPAAARKVALHSCQQQAMWRHREQIGWRVDVDKLRAEIESCYTSKRQLTDEFGIDLVTAATAADRARIHNWLAGYGIEIRDQHGDPTLARNAIDEVNLTDLTSEARDAWWKFRRARSNYSRMAKLLEIKSALQNGRIYTHLQLRATITGRSTSARPALQNIHRDLRGLLIADRGKVLVSLDLSTIEPRIAAALSGDQRLAADIASGDLYTSFARRLWGASASDEAGGIIQEHRDIAKTAMLQTFYGSGSATLAQRLGPDTTVATAQQLIDGLWAAYPQLRSFRDQLNAAARRRRPDPYASGRPSAYSPRGDHAALNIRIQGEAADAFLELSSAALHRLGPRAAWLSVFDELVVEVPEAHAEQARQILQETMCAQINGIPLTGQAQILGAAWRK
ncbi:DNA polymerase [Leifsonia sp. NPDC056665]|uniref:DNA polymerase n=1 Tax=Leifsonia sp. NPDC056665 TaxID=3345901 RepID=UPI0036957BF5